MTIKTHTPELPETTGFLRLPDVLRLFPVSKTSWYRGIEQGIYPKPAQLASRTVAWRTEDIRTLIERANATATAPPKFIRKKAVLELTGLSSASVYSMMARNLFPQSIKLSEKSVAWVLSEVESWQENRLATRHQAANNAKGLSHE